MSKGDLMAIVRCHWVNNKNKNYVKYHDKEWGVPVYDDHKLFEILVLEIFQAGLSWEIVLNKRAFFKKAFDGYDFDKISNYDDHKIMELCQNSNIVRNKSKILAIVNNASVFQNIIEEYGSFANYIWSFTNHEIIYESNLVRSQLSDQIAKDLKDRGMKFMGSITIYAYLQATGVINGHDQDCYKYKMI